MNLQHAGYRDPLQHQSAHLAMMRGPNHSRWIRHQIPMPVHVGFAHASHLQWMELLQTTMFSPMGHCFPNCSDIAIGRKNHLATCRANLQHLL